MQRYTLMPVLNAVSSVNMAQKLYKQLIFNMPMRLKHKIG